jgi:hypothetical protein
MDPKQSIARNLGMEPKRAEKMARRLKLKNRIVPSCECLEF